MAPRRAHVGSPSWSFWANTVSASRLVTPATRKRIYRWLGLDISPQANDIGAGCYFHSFNIAIGARTFINDYCYFENVERVIIGDDVALGMQVAIVTSTHELGAVHRRSGPWKVEPVRIEDGCWIGARALILPGVTIGRGAVVAAGAVVASDCEPNRVYGGVPARVVRDLEPL